MQQEMPHFLFLQAIELRSQHLVANDPRHILAVRSETSVVRRQTKGILPSHPTALSETSDYSSNGIDALASQITYISPANNCFGRDECIADRFSSSSNASLESFTMVIVWPMAVTELIGPVRGATLALPAGLSSV